MEDNFLVDFGDFIGDFRIIHVMILEFRCSEDKEGLFGFMADTFMSR